MSVLDKYLDQVYVAKSQQDYDDALQLRYEHICKWNDYQEDKGTAALSIGDQFDAYTNYIVHRGEDGKVDGILRLIRRSPHGFFMERYLTLSDHLNVSDRTIELCELVTHKDQRTNTWIIGSILIRLGRYLIDQKASSMAAISIDAMHPTMIRLGFDKVGQGYMTGWNKRMTLFVCDDLKRVLRNIIMVSPPPFRMAIADYYGIEL